MLEKMAIYKPKREASEETNPADTLISDLEPPERVNFLHAGAPGAVG